MNLVAEKYPAQASVIGGRAWEWAPVSFAPLPLQLHPSRQAARVGAAVTPGAHAHAPSPNLVVQVFHAQFHESAVAVKLLLGPAAEQASPEAAAEAALALDNPIPARLRAEAGVLSGLRHRECAAVLGTACV